MTNSAGENVQTPKFKIVCDACGSLSIKIVTDPENVLIGTVVVCACCNAPRGTLEGLQHLARQGTGDSFEF